MDLRGRIQQDAGKEHIMASFRVRNLQVDTVLENAMSEAIKYTIKMEVIRIG